MAMVKLKLPWTNYNGLLGQINFVNSEATVAGQASDPVFQKLNSILAGITYEIVPDVTSIPCVVGASKSKKAPLPRPGLKITPQAMEISKPGLPDRAFKRPVDLGACFDGDDGEDLRTVVIPVAAENGKDEDNTTGDMQADDSPPPRREAPPNAIEMERRIKEVQDAAAKKGKTLVKVVSRPKSKTKVKKKR